MQTKVTLVHKLVLSGSTLGFLLMLTVVCIPGWIRISYVPPHLLVQGGVDQGVVAMGKRDADGDSYMRHRQDKHHPYPHHEEKHFVEEHRNQMPPFPRGQQYATVCISAGLFYMSVCVHDEKGHDAKCQWVSYFRPEKAIRDMPWELRGLGLESVYQNMAGVYDVSKIGFLEIRVEALVAVTMAVIATITGIVYVRNVLERRRTGILTVISHIVAGVLMAVVVGKVCVALLQLKQSLTYITMLLGTDYFFHLAFPYAMLMGGMAALLTLTSSFCLLLTLSKGKRYNVAMPYISTQAASGFKVGILSAPAYKPEEDKAPLKYMEEPLPEKVPLA